MFRRLRWLLLAVIILALVAVSAVYFIRQQEIARQRPKPNVPLPDNTSATAEQWSYDVRKGDVVTCRIRARSFRQIKEPSTVLLQGLEMEIRNNEKQTYDLVKSAEASFDAGDGQLYSDGAVEIRLRLPMNGAPPPKKTIIRTTGAHYDSRSQRVWTERHVDIEFDRGTGMGEGADYNPQTHAIALNAKVHFVMGATNDAAKPPMVLDAAQAVYRELDSRVDLVAPVHFARGTLSMDGANAAVHLNDGEIDTIDSTHVTGVDRLPKRTVDFGAQTMKLYFASGGTLKRIEGSDSARIVSKDTTTNAGAETRMTATRLDMDLEAQGHESVLRHVLATGAARIETVPPTQAARSADAGPRIITSEKVDVAMKPTGNEIDVAHTLAPGRVEFLPAVSGGRTRQLDANELTAHYAAQNILREFNARGGTTTKTVTPPAPPKPGTKASAPVVTVTRSRDLDAHFDARGQLTAMEQRVNFEYEQEARRARSASATLDEVNSITTLRGNARSWDEGGSVDADEIRLEQKTGYTIAQGHVTTTRLPERKDTAKSNAPTSEGLISNAEPVLARSRTMTAWERNTKIRYTGDAEMWQGATRITAREILVDKTAQRIDAQGNVVTRVPDKRDNAPTKGASASRTFSVVTAPEFTYESKTKQAFYRENAKLERTDLTVTSRYLHVFFEDVPKSGGGTETRLEHMEADGNVVVLQRPAGHARTARAEHTEYYPSEERMLLTGGSPEVSDPERGVTRGPRINWFAREDRVVVDSPTPGSGKVQTRSAKGRKQ